MAFDEQDLTRPAYRLGDFAVATAVAIPYSLAAREQLGLSTDDEEAVRSALCLTGWYAAKVYNGQAGEDVLISPGDIDESVQFLLTYGNDPDVLPDVDLSGFQQLDLFRAGFTRGPAVLRRRRLSGSEERGGELPPGGAHPGIVVPDDGEELHQVLAGRIAVLPRRAPDDVQQPVEGRLHVAGAEQEVRRAGLGGDVVGRGIGPDQRVGPGLLGPAEELHLAQGQPRLRMVGLGVEDRAGRPPRRRQVTALQRLLGRVQARVLGDRAVLRRRLPGPLPRSSPTPAR